MGVLLQAVPVKAFGLDANASPSLVASLRVPASLVFPLAVLNWLSRNADPSAARDAIFFSNMTAFTLVGIGDLLVTLMPGADPTGWVFVLINLSFAIAFFVVGRVNMSSRVLKTVN
jgi:hypothetical protein